MYKGVLLLRREGQNASYDLRDRTDVKDAQQ